MDATRTLNDRKRGGYWWRQCRSCEAWKKLENNFTVKNAMTGTRSRQCNKCKAAEQKIHRAKELPAYGNKEKRGEYGSTLSVIRMSDEVRCPKCEAKMTRRELGEHRKRECRGSV